MVVKRLFLPYMDLWARAHGKVTIDVWEGTSGTSGLLSRICQVKIFRVYAKFHRRDRHVRVKTGLHAQTKNRAQRHILSVDNTL